MGIETPIIAADATILAAWQRRVDARAEYEKIGVNGDTPAEKRLWGIIDQAEEEIRATIATSPEGVMIQLWIAVDHSIMTREEDDACTTGDILYFVGEHDRRQDWNTRLALAAIRSLQAMCGPERRIGQ